MDHCGYFLSRFISATLTLSVLCWPEIGFPRFLWLHSRILRIKQAPGSIQMVPLILKMANGMLVSIVTDLSIYGSTALCWALVAFSVS
jgi:hypothetical protein